MSVIRTSLRSSRRRFAAIAAVALATGVAFSAAAKAAWPPAGFTESFPGEVTQNPTFPDTVATDVTVYAPLPWSVPSHPAACDELHFLRVRHVDGPPDPSDADRVLIAQPGVLEGASVFYNIAGNLVTRARDEHGTYIEFWAVDRRPNCLEDMNGYKLAKSTGNPLDVINYYYKRKRYQGERFDGFLSPLHDAAWLVDMGMAQTVRDWNEIITRGIPDQADRQQTVYCGGHSLGGFVAGAYAEWDFDGNSATTADAGYNQCAGFFALDSVVSAEPMFDLPFGDDLTALLGTIPDGVVSLMRSGLFPRFVAIPGVLDPEIMGLLTGVGVAADLKPTAESNLIAYLPPNPNIEGSFRFYHSANLFDYFAPVASIRRIRYTNQALLATFTDDNAMPLSIVRASLGFFVGGSVIDKDFPLPGDLPMVGIFEQFGALLGGAELALPNDHGSFLGFGAPLYRWANYDEVGGLAIPGNSQGEPYTDSSKEVTDIGDFARAVGAVPMDLVEKYFPIRLALDSLFGTDGTVHVGGATLRPIINITAGDGPNMGAGMTGPDDPIVPGYNHLDVMTAAPVQNDGQPEPVATHLLDFLYD